MVIRARREAVGTGIQHTVEFQLGQHAYWLELEAARILKEWGIAIVEQDAPSWWVCHQLNLRPVAYLYSRVWSAANGQLVLRMVEPTFEKEGGHDFNILVKLDDLVDCRPVVIIASVGRGINNFAGECKDRWSRRQRAARREQSPLHSAGKERDWQ